VLVDEIDFLMTKKEEVLYQLFDWPHHSRSKLVTLAVANTLDFPEKLTSKIASRIGTSSQSVKLALYSTKKKTKKNKKKPFSPQSIPRADNHLP
jgi:Cdc6-like AAA superfamily ATPase